MGTVPKVWVATGLACLLLASGVIRAAVATPVALAQTPSSTEGADERIYLKVCSSCHDADHSGARRDRAQWMELIDRMAAAGATMTDNEFEVVLRYLVATAGRVNVNRGSTEELTQVLSVSPEDADRILKYRAERGPFADFDALVKVPRIDVRRLEERRNAISF